MNKETQRRLGNLAKFAPKIIGGEMPPMPAFKAIITGQDGPPLIVRLPTTFAAALILAPIVGAFAAKGVPHDAAVQSAKPYLDEIFRAVVEGQKTDDVKAE